jgi:phosphatidylglycerophosphate synthase
MGTVQSAPWWWAAAGLAAIGVVHSVTRLSPAAFAAGLAYLLASSVLLSLGLRRGEAARFGPATAVTATRSVLVAIVTAMVVSSFSTPVPAPILVSTVAVALALDAVDGYVARRTGTVTELGARFDMEVDAFLLLVLCAYDLRYVGAWVLAIGLMRYAFVGAAWLLPWMGASLPPRYWRKVVTAICGIALTMVATGSLPGWLDSALAGIALVLLIESFGRDVVWLVRTRQRVAVEEPARVRPHS